MLKNSMSILNLLPKKIGNIYFYGNRKTKRIALTFDDGPSKETEKLLNILKKYKSKATFFVLGKKIKGKEKSIKRIIKEGHEIGNHSYNHYNLWFKNKKFIEKEINQTEEELKKIGIKNNLFRPPSSRMGLNLLKVCKKLKKKMIIGDTYAYDWNFPGAKKVVNKILKTVKKGSIIILHDSIEDKNTSKINKDITEITKKIIPELKKRGYKLVRVSELLNI